jgi:hypothetical protein
MHYFDPGRPKLGNMPMLVMDGTHYGVLPSWDVTPRPDGSFDLRAYASVGSGRARQMRHSVPDTLGLQTFFTDWLADPEKVLLLLGWTKSEVSPAPKARTASIDINLTDLDLKL